MGNKSKLLEGALGDIVRAVAVRHDQFCDLFSGSGSVAALVAEAIEVPVLASDTQEYARVLAASVVERTAPVDCRTTLEPWVLRARERARAVAESNGLDASAQALDRAIVMDARRFSTTALNSGRTLRHYGGHYFSPWQAMSIDAALEELPRRGEARTVALAALIEVASHCAASPGHTAQPFQPGPALVEHIEQAWRRDVFALLDERGAAIGSRFARARGESFAKDAIAAVRNVKEHAAVFLDPPYSAVQYSRFYHVLEGIARGGWDSVEGAGRAPAKALRVSSDFSTKGGALGAMERLLDALATKHCEVVVTFPAAVTSLGLSAESIARLAAKHWSVDVLLVDTTHSSLGGSAANGSRAGRAPVKEAVLRLT